MIPSTGTPSRSNAIRVPKIGSPEMKALVPSTGSMTQT